MRAYVSSFTSNFTKKGTVLHSPSKGTWPYYPLITLNYISILFSFTIDEVKAFPEKERSVKKGIEKKESKKKEYISRGSYYRIDSEHSELKLEFSGLKWKERPKCVEANAEVERTAMLRDSMCHRLSHQDD